ncbi:MAG TPA: LysR family transcriptional regulator [Bacillales bacterium]|nr:LysR family transcriptional regulator [Bacillales bacterium]
MDLEQVEAFLTVARTQNFTRAAEELNVVQSTITARIKMLEQNVGKELFKRRTRSVEITPAGETFFPYAERIMESM